MFLYVLDSSCFDCSSTYLCLWSISVVLQLSLSCGNLSQSVMPYSTRPFPNTTKTLHDILTFCVFFHSTFTNWCIHVLLYTFHTTLLFTDLSRSAPLHLGNMALKILTGIKLP